VGRVCHKQWLYVWRFFVDTVLDDVWCLDLVFLYYLYFLFV
jgi:hypothetical protein